MRPVHLDHRASPATRADRRGRLTRRSDRFREHLEQSEQHRELVRGDEPPLVEQLQHALCEAVELQRATHRPSTQRCRAAPNARHPGGPARRRRTGESRGRGRARPSDRPPRPAFSPTLNPSGLQPPLQIESGPPPTRRQTSACSSSAQREEIRGHDGPAGPAYVRSSGESRPEARRLIPNLRSAASAPSSSQNGHDVDCSLTHSPHHRRRRHVCATQAGSAATGQQRSIWVSELMGGTGSATTKCRGRRDPVVANAIAELRASQGRKRCRLRRAPGGEGGGVAEMTFGGRYLERSVG